MDAIRLTGCAGPTALALTALTLALSSLALSSPVLAQPRPSPPYLDTLLVETVATLPVAEPTQMTWGPGGKLYIRTASGEVVSYAYNHARGEATSPRIVASGIPGIGIAFHKDRMYLSGMDGSLWKLDDRNKNGVYGEQGELRVALVTGIPVGDHTVNQLQVWQDTLYVGIGRRTINGRRGQGTMGSASDDPFDRGFWGGGSGFSWGDGAYGGTIASIKNLNAVINTTGSANTYSSTTLTRSLIQEDDSPYSILQRLSPPATDGKLLIHSAGTRNPFGLCLDNRGSLYFTNNYNRTDTLGNGFGGPGLFGDALDNDFRNDVHDQVFQAVQGADYGYSDDNWRPRSPLLNPDTPGYLRVNSLTFDNLFHQGPFTLHNPANPVGLGPHSSSNGCDFYYAPNLPSELRNKLFIARWSGAVQEAPQAGDQVQHILQYADVVAVDPQNGQVRRVAQGFASPIDVLRDNGQRLLIADYGSGVLYALRPAVRRAAVRATLTRQGGNLVAEVRIINTGDLPFSGLVLAGAWLKNVASSSGLPVNLGTLAPGAASAPVTLTFPVNSPTGLPLFLRVKGNAASGTVYIQSVIAAP